MSSHILGSSKSFCHGVCPVASQDARGPGIRRGQLELMQSHLTNRKQSVRIGDFISIELTTTFYGIPLGSIIGPILFSIYMNQIGMSLKT